MRLPLPEDRRWRLGTGVSGALVLLLWLTVGCAKIPAAPPSEGGPVITVACKNNITTDQSILEWELRVIPTTIESSGQFTAALRGDVWFLEDFLDQAQPLVAGGLDELNLVALNATVQVRSGASGDDVTLTVAAERWPYECARRSTPCDPANDLPSVPGLVGNTDCEGETALNPCGRFVKLPISTDCDPGGACDDRGKFGPGSQCEQNGFCITGDLQLPLEEQTGRYTADSEGHVLFGWADGESTGATVQEGGPNDGTWILPEVVYADEPGPISLRVTVGGVPVALGCTMGVDSKDPDLGVGSLDLLSSPTPNRALIASPIGQPF